MYNRLRDVGVADGDLPIRIVEIHRLRHQVRCSGPIAVALFAVTRDTSVLEDVARLFSCFLGYGAAAFTSNAVRACHLRVGNLIVDSIPLLANRARGTTTGR